MLEQLGCLVDVAPDGQRAVEALEASSYDLVIMDCQMPVMDGFEATRAIRARESAEEHTPIIAMTANAMAGDRERCIEAGMDGYLTKPVRQDELAAAVSRWLPARADEPAHPAPEVEVMQGGAGRSGIRVLVDVDHLRGLREVGGESSAQFMTDLVDAFSAEGAEEIAQIRESVAGGDASRLVQVAHRLKGSALNLGCQAMADTAGELESLGRTGTLDGAAALVERLGREFEQTLTLLRIETAAA